MIEKQYEHYDYEPSIDLKNLAGHLLIKWKVILICSIIAAVIGGVIGLSKQAGVEKVQTSASEDSISEAKSKLSDDQITEAEIYYSQIVAYDQAIDEQKRFNDQAYIMSLDPDKAVGMNIQYLVETDVENALSAYSVSILSENDLEDIEKLLGADFGLAGLEDAIVFRSIETKQLINYDPDYSRRMTLSVRIIAPDNDSCDGISNIVDAAIERKTELLKDKGVVFGYDPVDQEYYTDVRNYIIPIRQEYISSLDNLIADKNSFLNNVVAKLDTDEKTYIDAQRGTISEKSGTEIEENRVEHKSVFQYLLFGMIVGFAISVCYFAFRYIAEGKLRTASDISECLNIPVLWTLSKNEKETKTDIITRIGYKIKGAERVSATSFTMLCDELNSMTEREGIKRVYVATDNKVESAVELASKIAERTSEDVDYVTGRLDMNADDLKHFLSSEGVILLPVFDATKIELITLFVNICDRNGKYLIGVAPIREDKD